MWLQEYFIYTKSLCILALFALRVTPIKRISVKKAERTPFVSLPLRHYQHLFPLRNQISAAAERTPWGIFISWKGLQMKRLQGFQPSEGGFVHSRRQTIFLRNARLCAYIICHKSFIKLLHVVKTKKCPKILSYRITRETAAMCHPRRDICSCGLARARSPPRRRRSAAAYKSCPIFFLPSLRSRFIARTKLLCT